MQSLRYGLRHYECHARAAIFASKCSYRIVRITADVVRRHFSKSSQIGPSSSNHLKSTETNLQCCVCTNALSAFCNVVTWYKCAKYPRVENMTSQNLDVGGVVTPNCDVILTPATQQQHRREAAVQANKQQILNSVHRRTKNMETLCEYLSENTLFEKVEEW